MRASDTHVKGGVSPSVTEGIRAVPLEVRGCGKVRLVKAMDFPVFGCESWTIKKAERRRIDAFDFPGAAREAP